MAPIIDIRITDLFERFGDLCQQEEEVYRCHDYLSSNYQVVLGQEAATQSRVNTISSSTFNSCSSRAFSKSEGINELWRKKICEWTFQIVDHFDINREIASISLNYLDRYLSKRIVNRKMFQLVAMASLFLAIKLHEPTPIRMSSFIELSRNHFKTEHIALMGSSILWTLSWHVRPPTPLVFVKNYMLLLELSGCTATVVLGVKEVARFLTELSVYDYYFTTRKPSSIGLGAILTAFKRFDEATLPTHVRCTFIKLVRSMEVIDPSSDEVLQCKGRLSAKYLHDTGYQ